MDTPPKQGNMSFEDNTPPAKKSRTGVPPASTTGQGFTLRCAEATLGMVVTGEDFRAWWGTQLAAGGIALVGKVLTGWTSHIKNPVTWGSGVILSKEIAAVIKQLEELGDEGKGALDLLLHWRGVVKMYNEYHK